eukprot:CAMPEP_0180580906 /NCGR_PEP_ID=MMETSP1037_2-20121125/13774_1 /TAXON_ID=632150 /ORGANISM="Azadinium spinosum, Strain 3D9" /LENGTH=117 /DNA_ID=CAMNT_0022598865 /DNA_START=407 /DNA_END=759 /DNA_ORIENTATION=+
MSSTVLRPKILVGPSAPLPAEHKAEAEEICRSGDETSAGGEETRSGPDAFENLQRPQLTLFVGPIHGGEALGIFFRYPEASVFHAEWLENIRLEIPVEGLAAQDLDEPPKHIRGGAI